MSIPARPLVGYLADYHIGPINAFLTGEAILAMMIYAWIGVTTRTGLYVFSAFFGFANGACQGTFVGANASLTRDPKKMGTRFGMIQTLSAISSLAGAPTAGAIIDKSGGSLFGRRFGEGPSCCWRLALWQRRELRRRGGC